MRAGLNGLAWVVVMAAVAARAGVPGGTWRGDPAGCYADTQPPLAWGPESNVVWRTALPEWSNASPLVTDDRVYVCAEPATLLCLDRANGKLLWQRAQDYADLAPTPAEAEKARQARLLLPALEARLQTLSQAARKAAEAAKKAPQDDALELASRDAEQARTTVALEIEPYARYRYPAAHALTGQATPSPLSDGKHIFMLSAIGTLAAYLPDGSRLWAVDVGRPQHNWGHSASPLLADGLLVVQVGNRLSARDPATGAEKWQAQSAAGWGTPAVARIGGRALVLATGGNWFDAKSGVKLADDVLRFPWNGPVVDVGVVYKMDEDGAAAVALTADGTPLRRWTAAVPKARYYATAVTHGGLLYNIDQTGRLTVLDVADGAKVYGEKLDFGKGSITVYPSPVLAGGRLYVSADNGVTLVLAPGREFRVLARNTLEPFRSTPVFAGGQMVVRTLRGVCCIAERNAAASVPAP